MFDSLSISNFRGFEKLEVPRLERFNLVLGKNNVGKTALLEAAFLLSGGNNPHVAQSLDEQRGFVASKDDAREYWGWLFFQKETDRQIVLATTIHNRLRSLAIRLDTSEEWPFKSPGQPMGISGGTVGADPMKYASLYLNFEHESGGSDTVRVWLTEFGFRSIQGKPRASNDPGVIVRSSIVHASENLNRFSKLKEVGDDKELYPWLQIVEPRLCQFEVLVSAGNPVLYVDLGAARMVPIQLMGDGTGRLLTMLLAISDARGGVVLIDEIDSGLHYSVMTDVWKAIAGAARAYDVQLIATTHSWECLRSAHEAFDDDEKYDLLAHRLDRIDDNATCFTFDKEHIEMALMAGLEIR